MLPLERLLQRACGLLLHLEEGVDARHFIALIHCPLHTTSNTTVLCFLDTKRIIDEIHVVTALRQFEGQLFLVLLALRRRHAELLQFLLERTVYRLDVDDLHTLVLLRLETRLERVVVPPRLLKVSTQGLEFCCLLHQLRLECFVFVPQSSVFLLPSKLNGKSILQLPPSPSSTNGSLPCTRRAVTTCRARQLGIQKHLKQPAASSDPRFASFARPTLLLHGPIRIPAEDEAKQRALPDYSSALLLSTPLLEFRSDPPCLLSLHLHNSDSRPPTTS